MRPYQISMFYINEFLRNAQPYARVYTYNDVDSLAYCILVEPEDGENMHIDITFYMMMNPEKLRAELNATLAKLKGDNQ